MISGMIRGMIRGMISGMISGWYLYAVEEAGVRMPSQPPLAKWRLGQNGPAGQMVYSQWSV